MTLDPSKDGGWNLTPTPFPSQPAFPVLNLSELRPSHVKEFERLSSGMSLRQYAAIHAPVSLVDANESLHQTTKFGKPEGDGAFPMRQVVAESVRLSVMYADMLLAELAKDQGTAEMAQSLSEKDQA